MTDYEAKKMIDTEKKQVDKLCVDCKYYYTIEYDRMILPTTHLCSNPNTKITDLVTGAVSDALCSTARVTSCAKLGFFWEAKDGNREHSAVASS